MDKDNRFFSNTKPNLISEKVMKKLDKLLEKSSNAPTSNTMVYIYENYIQPNLFAIIVIVVLAGFLFIRHMIKKYKEENKQVSDSETEPEDTEKDTEISLEDESIDDIDDKKDEITEDEITENPNNPTNFDTLRNQYEQSLKENSGMMSDQHIKDVYSKKNDRMVFDELTRMIVEGGSNE